MKIFLTYEEQVLHLETDKKIIMNSLEKIEMIELLNKYNYYNLINSVKLVHVIGKSDINRHVYDPVEFHEWKNTWKIMNAISYELSKEILETEKYLNTFVSHQISKQYVDGSLDSKLRDSYTQTLLHQSKVYKYELPLNRDGNIDLTRILSQSWKYIPKLTFGGLYQIFLKIDKSEASEFFNKSKISNYTDLKIVKYLRNELLHNTPLLIVMNHKDKIVRNERRRTIKKLLRSDENIIIDEWGKKLVDYWTYTK